MWMLRPPRESQVIEFLLRSASKPVNYLSDVSLESDPAADRFATRVHLGTGRESFENGVRAMQSWAMIRAANADLFWPDRGLTRGTTLAIGMRTMGLYWLNPCRITEIVDSRDHHEQVAGTDTKVSIRWRTVEGHSLKGSETFMVHWDRDASDDDAGDVWYEVSSIAVPVTWLRPWRSMINRFRTRFQAETCRRMRTLVGADIPHNRTSVLHTSSATEPSIQTNV